MCDHQSLRSACAYAQADQSLCLSLEYAMTVKLLMEHHLEFLSLKGGYTGLSESTLVKMPHCRKSHVTAHLVFYVFCSLFSSAVFVVSSARKERAGCFTAILPLLNLISCDCLCPVSLPRGAMGWSAVCDYGIFCSYMYLFLEPEHDILICLSMVHCVWFLANL